MANLKLLFCVFTLAFISGCKSTSYFRSSNDLLNEDSHVVLMNGTEIDGKLTVQFETGHETNKQLSLVTKEGATKKIIVSDVKYYIYNGDYYFPKEINLEAYEIPARDKVYTPNVNNLLFVKRLTPENAKMSLYELYQPRTQSTDGADHFDYFVSLKNDDRLIAWSIRGPKFFPDFDYKVGTIVEDCPTLAEKVKQRQSGYFVKQLSIDGKKEEVFKRIVKEYNNCR
ncbi:MAG: hypothetical protein HY252_10600 [Sphingobacteriales bacterium]|nr:hypothetical protein [Sphingobacteriales bacterium]